MARDIHGVKFRTKQVIIFSEDSTEPRIEVLRERIEIVDTVTQRTTSVVTVAIADLLQACPEYKHILRDIPDCIDLYHERLGLDK